MFGSLKSLNIYLHIEKSITFDIFNNYLKQKQ